MIVSQRLVAINAASSLGARLLNVTVLLWMYQYLLTRISPEEFAVYAVLMALMAFAPLFFSVFTGGVSRYIVEAYALDQPRRVAEITSSILPLLGAASATFLLSGLVVAVFIEDILNIAPGMEDTARLMLCLLVANYALQMVTLPFATGFHVRQRFVELNMLGVLRDVLRIILLVTLLVGIGPSVLWVVVASVISDQAHLAAVLFRSRQLVPEVRFKSELFRWETGRKLVSFGLWTTLGQLANLMVTSVGVLILNAYGTALDVTVYHLGATAFRQIESAIGLAAFPLLPALTAMHSLADRARLARTTLRGGRYGLWVSLFVACPAAILLARVRAALPRRGFRGCSDRVELVHGHVPLPRTHELVAHARDGDGARARLPRRVLHLFAARAIAHGLPGGEPGSRRDRGCALVAGRDGRGRALLLLAAPASSHRGSRGATS